MALLVSGWNRDKPSTDSHKGRCMQKPCPRVYGLGFLGFSLRKEKKNKPNFLIHF